MNVLGIQLEIPMVWWVVVGLIAGTTVSVYLSVVLATALVKERHRRRQLSARYGLMTEQFLPLAATYPWNARHFRFLGSPIDGIQFNEDQIILVEFKSGQSQLSES